MCITINHIRSRQRNDFQLDIKDVHIENNQIVSIVGANGCGKTTFMETLLGLIPFDIRELTIFGKTVASFERDSSNKMHLGVQLQKSQYHSEMQVRDLVRLYKIMYGKASDFIFSALDIKDLFFLKYDKLSRGQRQRVDLYLALSHEPKLLLLDEPSTGLDAKYQSVLTELIQYLRAKSTTVLMVSHSRSEIDVSDKVILMAHGQIKSFDSYPEIVANNVGQYKLTARCVNPDISKATHQYLELNDSVKSLRYNKEDLSFCVYLKNNILNDIVDSFSANAFTNLSVSESELDDVIFSTLAKELTS